MEASIYIASPWIRKSEAKAAAVKFKEAGFIVTSRWHENHHGSDAPEPDATIMRQEALNDIEDIMLAEIIVVLNLEKSEGKAVETGMAMAMCKGIILVGKPSNVFHYLDIPRATSVEEAIEVARNYPWLYVPEVGETIN